jgi:hypothetical protein
MLKVVFNNLNPLDQTAENIKLHILTDKDSCICESGDGTAVFYAKAAKKGKDGKKKSEKKNTDKDKGKGEHSKCKDQKKKCTHCNFISHNISKC